MRAAREMMKGEEVTDSYISVLQPAMERRRAIRRRYGFELQEDRILVEEHLFSQAEGCGDFFFFEVSMLDLGFEECDSR